MDLIIIITACLVAVTSSIIGCFLILRKMAMVGDAISHSVLPGIVIAFMMGGKLGSWYLLVGAAVFGIITTFLIEFFNKKGGMQHDATIGVVFTSLFALGIILVTVYARDVDIDQDCVLYGELDHVAIEDGVHLSGLIIPYTVIRLSVMLLCVIALVIIGYRGLFLTTFDAAYAATIGISVMSWHYILMAAVSLSTVLSFGSVGAILVVAFLITPPATAYLLTDKLKQMIFLSVLFGITGSIIGYYFATAIDGATSAAIASVLGMQFIVVFVWKVVEKRFSRKETVAQ
ncbi:MAG: metal ABC transporter permease [Bacteroidetes bacterium]|nr:metal ABC transporter permease [Bacteroidota bacterium]